ncbi:hypothetical protein [Parvibium lacunae]|uniref:hypothetical protein n=1 Tax=Parvibium lacunae TaxID=1888893 RepID=UPI0011C0442E|nr:hypothetical protein [Parvibium lacunae]
MDIHQHRQIIALIVFVLGVVISVYVSMLITDEILSLLIRSFGPACSTLFALRISRAGSRVD